MKKNKETVIDWNNRFPLDKWWRSKYNVPFLSDIHRKSTFYAQLFEWEEELAFKEYREERKEAKENPEKVYQPLSGNWWQGLEPSEEEIEDWFNKPL